jgi:hypothetical protein
MRTASGTVSGFGVREREREKERIITETETDAGATMREPGDSTMMWRRSVQERESK